MDRLTESVVTIAVAIIGLATLAVLVGRNARTTQVIDSASKGFIGSIGAAIAPVMGGGGYGSGFQMPGY